MSLRIAFVSSHPVPYHVPTYRALAKRPGVELTVLFTHHHGVEPTFDRGFGREVKFDVPLLDGYSYRFPKNYARHPSLTFTGQINPQIPIAAMRGEYDAIVVHGYQSISTVATLIGPRVSGRRTRVLLRGESNSLHDRPLRTRLAKEIVLRTLFSRVDHFLGIGSQSTAYFAEYGVPAARITVAPYTVDNDYFLKRSEPARRDPAGARRLLGLPTDRPLFLYCSKVVSHKRPLDLLRAFAIARKSVPCALAYVGDGAQIEELRATIERLGLGDDVFVLGFRNQSELPGIYGMSDVFILPSEREPWGMVVNEAMASGAAICTSDRVGSAYDLVRDNGAMFPMGDVGKLAEFLAGWASDPQKLREMKNKSLQRIGTWSAEQTADGVLAGIEKAMSR